MRWTKALPIEPGQYKVRRTYWGGRTTTETVKVYEDEGLWVVEYSNSLAPDINQPMEEWLEQQPPVRWLGPIETSKINKEELK